MTNRTQRLKVNSGETLPLFNLPAVNNEKSWGPGDFKQHQNLVLIFFASANCRRCKQLLREIASHYGEYHTREAEVLAISTDENKHLDRLARELVLPFPLLNDTGGKVTARYLNQTDAAPESAVFIADRWNLVFTTHVTEEEQDVLREPEIREWLEFIELQCEECFPSEWPREAGQ